MGDLCETYGGRRGDVGGTLDRKTTKSRPPRAESRKIWHHGRLPRQRALALARGPNVLRISLQPPATGRIGQE